MLDSITHPSAPIWTFKNEELLERLWADKALSARKIGQALGGFSRNAILGKVHRMGLDARAPNKGERKPDGPHSKRKHGPDYYIALRAKRESLVEEACKMKVQGIPLAVIARHMGRSGTWVSQNTMHVEAPKRERAFTLKTGTFRDVNLSEIFTSWEGTNQVPLLDRTGDQCCWPLGDPLRESFRVCGDPCAKVVDRFGVERRSSYCDCHHACAYVRAS